MAIKKPPYNHPQMAELLFISSVLSKNKGMSFPTRLKIESYTLFFTVLPHLITLAIWVAIAVTFYRAVLLI
jgi:hypothetical protein